MEPEFQAAPVEPGVKAAWRSGWLCELWALPERILVFFLLCLNLGDFVHFGPY